MRIRKTSTAKSDGRQIDVETKTLRKKEKAIIDCGADIDYVNEKWCTEKKLPVKIIGKGLIKGLTAKGPKEISRKHRSVSGYKGNFKDRNSEFYRKPETIR